MDKHVSVLECGEAYLLGQKRLYDRRVADALAEGKPEAARENLRLAEKTFQDYIGKITLKLVKARQTLGEKYALFHKAEEGLRGSLVDAIQEAELETIPTLNLNLQRVMAMLENHYRKAQFVEATIKQIKDARDSD